MLHQKAISIYIAQHLSPVTKITDKLLLLRSAGLSEHKTLPLRNRSFPQFNPGSRERGINQSFTYLSQWRFAYCNIYSARPYKLPYKPLNVHRKILCI